MEFAHIAVLTIFCFISGTVYSEICGSCFCEEPVDTCFITSCSSEIVRSPEVEIIKLHGFLYTNHISQLSDIFYYNTIIEVVDGKCPLEISNCR